MTVRPLLDLHRWLLGFAAAYLALLPTNSATFPRSVAFGGACILALLFYWQARRNPATRIGFAGPSIMIPLLVWAVWSTASLAWSVRPRYSFLQLEREVMDSLLAMFAIYVATRDTQSMRILIATMLGAFAAYALLAIAMAFRYGLWDASLHHHGVGPYSTWVVLAAPLLFALIAPPPAGFGNGARSAVLGIALLVLMVATARMTDNRMVWVALAAAFGTASIAAAFRWPQARLRARMRWMLPLAALLLVLGFGFTDALKGRGQLLDPPQTDISDVVEKDPRRALWDRVIETISARPLHGYGFGRAIVEFDLRPELSINTALAHAHNLLLSQWLQTGAVGVGAFVALIVALTVYFLRFLRSRDDPLAFAGVVGLALVVGFMVKNLTDDFLFRSNAKEFWVLSAMLLGFGVRREAQLSTSAARLGRFNATDSASARRA